MIAKYIVLSNIISVVSDNILRICIQEHFLILKNFVVFLHTLSACKGLLTHYKNLSSNPRNVCIQSKGMARPMKTLVLIDPAPFRNNLIKKESFHTKLSAPLLGKLQ